MNYGGTFEYVAAVLLVVQIFVAGAYLRKRRASWPRPLWVAVRAILILLWATTLAALYIVLFGVMYASRLVPVVLGTTVAALGYGWIMVSSAATAVVGGARFVLAR